MTVRILALKETDSWYQDIRCVGSLVQENNFKQENCERMRR
jgi:hypothetical protein